MKCCIFMPTTINIDTNSSLYKSSQLTENDLRYKQYFEGIQKIYQFNIEKKLHSSTGNMQLKLDMQHII